MLYEFRCDGILPNGRPCKSLLCKTDEVSTIQIKCRKCKKIHYKTPKRVNNAKQ